MRVDLNEVLIRHPQATFLMRVSGPSMPEAGIDDGDVVLVDRAIKPVHGHVVVAVVDNEFTVADEIASAWLLPMPTRCLPVRDTATSRRLSWPA